MLEARPARASSRARGCDGGGTAHAYASASASVCESEKSGKTNDYRTWGTHGSGGAYVRAHARVRVSEYGQQAQPPKEWRQRGDYPCSYVHVHAYAHSLRPRAWRP